MTTEKIKTIIRERFQQKWIAKQIECNYIHLNQIMLGNRPMTEEMKTNIEKAIREAHLLNPRKNNSMDVQ